ncbi:MAG: surface lipoprotein assembly modifier [Rhodobacterales bacterium]|nr:surface lipoprotein assembly modifier [Rhodobacterales bacterium]
MAIRAQYAQRTYAGNLFKNGSVSQLSARYTHVVTPALLLRAEAVVVRTNATGARHSGTNTALSIGGQFAFSGGFVANLDVNLGVDQRNGIHPLFGVTRQDRRRSVALRLRKRDLRIGNFVPEISVGYTNVKSTLPINSYRNTYMSLQLSRQF